MKGDTRNVFTGRQRNLICWKLAAGMTARQVVDWAKDEFDLECSIKNIYESYLENPRNKSRIRRYKRYLDHRVAENIHKTATANKLWRIQKLQEAVNEALTWHTKRSYYSKDGEFCGEDQEKKLGVVSACLAELRREYEGEGATVAIDNRNGTLTLVQAGRLILEAKQNGGLHDTRDRIHKELIGT